MLRSIVDRLRTADRAISVLLVVATGLVGLLMYMYVSEPHSPRRTAFALGGFAAVALVAAATLAVLHHRRASVVLMLASTLVLVSGMRAVRQWQEDFAKVVPLPLIDQPDPIRGAKLPAPAAPPAEETAAASTSTVSLTEAGDPKAVKPRGASTAMPGPISRAIESANNGSARLPAVLGTQENHNRGQRDPGSGLDDPPTESCLAAQDWCGWSGFSVVNGYAVTLEQRGEYRTVSLYASETGEELWSYQTRTLYQNPEWPQGGIGPRSTPTIHEGRVYALGATGRLLCLDGSDGTLIWDHDLLAESEQTPETEQRFIPFGRSASPLIARNLVVVPVGGKRGDPRLVSVAAFDKRTGKKVWAAGTRQISMSSPTLMTLAGVEQVVVVNEDTVTGHDLATGRILWEQAWVGDTQGPTNVAQAMPVSPNRFFVSRSYNDGSAVYEVSAAAGVLQHP